MNVELNACVMIASPNVPKTVTLKFAGDKQTKSP